MHFMKALFALHPRTKFDGSSSKGAGAGGHKAVKRNRPLRSAYLTTSLGYMHEVTKIDLPAVEFPFRSWSCKIAFNTLHDIYHHNQKIAQGTPNSNIRHPHPTNIGQKVKQCWTFWWSFTTYKVAQNRARWFKMGRRPTAQKLAKSPVHISTVGSRK